MIALCNFPLAYCLALAISKLHRALTGLRTLRQTRSLKMALAIIATQDTHSDPQDLGLTDERILSFLLQCITRAQCAVLGRANLRFLRLRGFLKKGTLDPPPDIAPLWTLHPGRARGAPQCILFSESRNSNLKSNPDSDAD
jgi:hypothetical protein